MRSLDAIQSGNNVGIHATAVVDPGAKIGANVSIGAYSVIGANVDIGDRSVIGPHVVIQGPTKIGEDNHIFQFASVGEVPQDKKFAGEQSQLIIGNNNTIREFCTINRGTSADNNATIIGDHNWIMAYVHIAHDCVIANHTVFSNGASLAGHVHVGDHVVLGGFTLVHQFCHIGQHAFCGMGTALNKDLAPYTMASGNLAKAFGLNKEGLRRRNFNEQVIQALHQAYKALILSKETQAERLASVNELAQEYEEVKIFVDFIQSSERGIVR